MQDRLLCPKKYFSVLLTSSNEDFFYMTDISFTIHGFVTYLKKYIDWLTSTELVRGGKMHPVTYEVISVRQVSTTNATLAKYGLENFLNKKNK